MQGRVRGSVGRVPGDYLPWTPSVGAVMDLRSPRYVIVVVNSGDPLRSQNGDGFRGGRSRS